MISSFRVISQRALVFNDRVYPWCAWNNNEENQTRQLSAHWTRKAIIIFFILLLILISLLHQLQCIINNFCADWHIHASYVQMDRVRNNTYMRHSIEYTGCRLTYMNANAITFRILVCLQRNFPQIFFITKHIVTENLIQIDQKLFELWSLVVNHFSRPRLQDFFKKVRCEKLFVNTQ